MYIYISLHISLSLHIYIYVYIHIYILYAFLRESGRRVEMRAREFQEPNRTEPNRSAFPKSKRRTEAITYRAGPKRTA